MKIPAAKRHQWFVITSFFNNENQIRACVDQLLLHGVPRDLIEVAVPEKLNTRFFENARRGTLSRITVEAARGALIGLILLSLVSAALIATSGARESRLLTLIMLFGPNIGVLAGGVIGLLYGALRRFPVPNRFGRIREEKGILLVLRSKSDEEAEALLHRLQACGGIDAKTELMDTGV
jgi:hypothetical protein